MGLAVVERRKTVRQTSYAMTVSGSHTLADGVQRLHALTCVRLWFDGSMALIQQLFCCAHALYGRLESISTSIGTDVGIVDGCGVGGRPKYRVIIAILFVVGSETSFRGLLHGRPGMVGRELRKWCDMCNIDLTFVGH